MEGLKIWLLLVNLAGYHVGGADVTVFETEQACLNAKQVVYEWFEDRDVSIFGTVEVDCIAVDAE